MISFFVFALCRTKGVGSSHCYLDSLPQVMDNTWRSPQRSPLGILQRHYVCTNCTPNREIGPAARGGPGGPQGPPDGPQRPPRGRPEPPEAPRGQGKPRGWILRISEKNPSRGLWRRLEASGGRLGGAWRRLGASGAEIPMPCEGKVPLPGST